MSSTITIPSADEQLAIAINKCAKARDSIGVPANQKFACVLLPLAPAVTPEDYPALKAAIEEVAGIQANVKLLIDGQAPESIPEGLDLRLTLRAQLRMDPTPEA